MKMSQAELYNAVAAWLMDMGYQPAKSEKEKGLFFWLDPEDGHILCRIEVEAGEKTPSTIHFFARFQTLVPQCHLSIAALALMNMNRGIRFGQFILAPENGLISYRFTHLLAGHQRLNHQFGFCLRQLVWFAETYGPIFRDFLRDPPEFEVEINRWKTFKTSQEQ